MVPGGDRWTVGGATTFYAQGAEIDTAEADRFYTDAAWTLAPTPSTSHHPTVCPSTEELNCLFAHVGLATGIQPMVTAAVVDAEALRCTDGLVGTKR